MLASPANQSTDAETTVADNQPRTANILALEFSGAQHEPVLLSPGKWNVGSASSNQILLNNAGIAARQFLIIVTEHRSVIKDWSARALRNGSPFESAVLADGDTVEVADVRLSFRLAESQDLISQLPYVAEPHCHEEVASPIDIDVAAGQGETRNTVHVTADGMLSFDDGADRLDELIRRIQSSLVPDAFGAVNFDSDTNSSQSAAQDEQFRFESATSPSNAEDDVVAWQRDGQALELQAARLDEELRQLEELRAAVQLDREQLLAKRELLIQETQQVESQLAEDKRATQPNAAHQDEAAFDVSVGQLEDQPSCDVRTDIDDEAVAVEREKLRHYLEEFDSVAATECNESAEVEVAVGATQATTDYSVMNSLRSREDAVKQLDELVLAATGRLSDRPAAASKSSFDAVTNDRTRVSSGGLASLADGESGLAGHSDEQSHSEVSVDDDIASELEVPDLEASFEELGALINDVESAATLADEEVHELSAHEPVSSSDFPDSEGTAAFNEQASIESNVYDYDGSLESSDDFDLSALAAGIDAENVESDFSLAEDEALSSVEFDDDECNAPSFGNDAVDDGRVVHEPVELASHESVAAEEIFTLQNLDSDEIVEEPSALDADGVDLADSDFEVEANGIEEPSANSESSSPDANSSTELSGHDLRQVDRGLPSWFDSEFMAEGDSEVDNELTDNQSDPGDVATDDESASCVGGELDGDLRQKLAEMFDLPAISERTDPVAPDSSLESRLQQFRDEQPAEELAEASTPVSPWSVDDSSGVVAESALGMDLDPTAVSETEAGLDFETETLDQFPVTVSDDSVEPAASSVSSEGSSFEPAEQGEEEDSISIYMERLLARNRQVTGGSSAPAEITASVPVAAPEAVSSAASISQSQTEDVTVATEDAPEGWLEDNPRHRQNRDQVRAEVQVLRQIANQSARSAVATASRRDVRKQVMVKTTASILALGSGVSALLLDVSMLFGLFVLGIGMVFSIDLALTIFRNWKQLRDLRKAAAALEAEASEVAAEATPVTT